MSNLAIIPARGGSKRIPGKNIKDFLGKPIICYSIRAALDSGLFDEVIVSTDDPEISDIAIREGAKVPFFRSKENADDFAPLSDVIKEVEAEYAKRGANFDHICCILPACPFITTDLIKTAFDQLIAAGADSIRPIVRFSYPIQRAFKLTGNQVEFFYPEYQASRSQDLEPAFHDAGMFYWLLAGKGFSGQHKIGFEISEYVCQDIDNDVDWKLAELKYQMNFNTGKDQ